MSEEKVSLGSIAPPAQPGEASYSPPVDAIPLPSKGKVYPSDSPLASAPVVEIRSMTARDEDILTSRALLKQGKAIDTLLKSCIVNKAIEPENMLVGDRNALLVAIRITGYGADYSSKIECPKCEEKSDYEFDLSQLPLKPLGTEPRAANTNEFTFLLPVSNKEVVFKLLSGADEREITAILDKGRKLAGLGGVESPITTRLLFSIVSLGGERDRAKLAQLVKNLPAKDSRELRNHIDKISPGIEMKQEFVCPSCSEISEVDVPMGTEFFWPSGK